MKPWRWLCARFSFRGRAARAEFWMTVPVTLLCALIGGGLILILFIWLSRADWPYALPLIAGLLLLDAALYFWAGLAVAVRRAHDLGLSYGQSFGLRPNFEGAFKRGTAGPNRFGPDPLQNSDKT